MKPLAAGPRRTALGWATAPGLGLVAFLAGCTVGPDFERPKPPEAPGYTRTPFEKTASVDGPEGDEQTFVLGKDVVERWWTLFGSTTLDSVVERALKASPTLRAAEAAIRQANELVLAQIGTYYPNLGAAFAPGYQKASAALSPPLSTNRLKYGLYTAQLTVGYTPDVFGGNRRTVESLEAQAEFQRFQAQAAYLTLISNVVTAAVQEASFRAQIAATREILTINTKALDLLKRQLAAGAVTGLDVAAQETALAQIQQTLPPLEKQLEQNRDLLIALSGGLPGVDLPETFELTALQLPRELPLTLPSKIVEQRPDVRAAEAQLHAASALIGVAVAKRLPQFTISGGYGGVATSIGHMFDPGNTFWSIVGSVSQSIFDGGTLLHQQRAAEAAFDQAGALYRSAVVLGFQNVADTLYALKADAENLKAAVAALHAAKVTLDITLRQQQAGQVNYLALLSAEQAYQQTWITRVQAQASRLTDTVALFQALGGGWWNRPTEDPKAP